MIGNDVVLQSADQGIETLIVRHHGILGDAVTDGIVVVLVRVLQELRIIIRQEIVEGCAGFDRAQEGLRLVCLLVVRFPRVLQRTVHDHAPERNRVRSCTEVRGFQRSFEQVIHIAERIHVTARPHQGIVAGFAHRAEERSHVVERRLTVNEIIFLEV